MTGRARPRRALAAALVLLALAGCASGTQRPDAPEAASGTRTGLATVEARRHIVAAANPLATEAGRDILRAGGSAVDAAIAMQMVLGLVEPQSSGLGGGAFLMHWDGRRVQSFDGRETAPAAADERLFLVDDKPMGFHDAAVGGRSVGTPGLLRMLELAHREHGVLPWARLFAPAIRLARDGFAVSPRLHALLASDRFLRHDAAARALFYGSDGAPLPVGARLRNPALADTLEAIAMQGAGAFYRGAIAADIVRAVRSHPNAGRLAASDLADYGAVERAPLCSDYRRWRVCGMAPPSSGGLAVAQMLGMLATTGIGAARPGSDGAPPVETIHLASEAARLAFADRNLYVADPAFAPVDTRALLAPDYLRERAASIGPRSMGTATPGRPAGPPLAWAPDRSPERIATSHLVAVDAAGRAVSMTTTIEDQFGARVMVRGFLLNNQLTDFSFVPQEQGRPVANRVQPGKRPRSSMAPTLVFDRTSGALVAALGSPGGSQIIGYVARTLLGLLDWGLDVQTAIAQPNFGSRNGPTELERGRFPAATVDALRARGHQVVEIEMTSGLQAVVRGRDAQGRPVWRGGADPRREGVVLGD